MTNIFKCSNIAEIKQSFISKTRLPFGSGARIDTIKPNVVLGLKFYQSLSVALLRVVVIILSYKNSPPNLINITEPFMLGYLKNNKINFLSLYRFRTSRI